MSAALPAVRALEREDKEVTHEYEMVDGSVRVDIDGFIGSPMKSALNSSLPRSPATKSSPTKKLAIKASSIVNYEGQL